MRILIVLLLAATMATGQTKPQAQAYFNDAACNFEYLAASLDEVQRNVAPKYKLNIKTAVDALKGLQANALGVNGLIDGSPGICSVSFPVIKSHLLAGRYEEATKEIKIEAIKIIEGDSVPYVDHCIYAIPYMTEPEFIYPLVEIIAVNGDTLRAPSQMLIILSLVDQFGLEVNINLPD